MLRPITFLCVLLLPLMAFAKDTGSGPPHLDKIKRALVHIIPSREADMNRLPLGCTGIYIETDLVGDKLLSHTESAIVLTNLSCLINDEALDKEQPEMEFIPFSVEDTQGRLFEDTTIIGYHRTANLVLVKIDKSPAQKTEQIVPVALDIDRPTPPIGVEKTDYPLFNLARPMAETETLYSIRFPSEGTSNDVMESNYHKELATKIANIDITYLMHQGDGLPNGFEGSPIVNSKGEIVGINSYSNFYFFNIGYDFASLIQQPTSRKQGALKHFSKSSNAEMDHFLGEDATKILINDAFEEALYIHRDMQMYSFERPENSKPTEIFFRTIVSKVANDNDLNNPSIFKLSYFQGLDYIMEYGFMILMNELDNIKIATMHPDKRTSEMNRMGGEIDRYFVIFKKLKRIVRLALTSDNPFLSAYQDKLDCKYEQYKFYAKHVNKITFETQLNTDQSISDAACKRYLDFMKKYQKDNYRNLKSEPYPKPPIDQIRAQDEIYLNK